MPSAFHTPNEHNSSKKKTTENFNKRGQLISTLLMRTFYDASAAEGEDQRRHRGRGDSAEDGTVDICSGTFRHRARVASRPAATLAF
jgi:hypothetical protein